MLQTLLADRFQLQFHREQRNLDGYNLVVANSGAKLKTSDPAEKYRMGSNFGPNPAGGGVIQTIVAENASIDELAQTLSGTLRQPVINATGLNAKYTYSLPLPPLSRDLSREAGIFTAVQETLGLRLKAEKIPVSVFVVDHVEKPKEP